MTPFPAHHVCKIMCTSAQGQWFFLYKLQSCKELPLYLVIKCHERDGLKDKTNS